MKKYFKMMFLGKHIIVRTTLNGSILPKSNKNNLKAISMKVKEKFLTSTITDKLMKELKK